jgi:hypothetical protein
MGTLTQDVVHYFLDPKFPPFRGAAHLAKYWRKYKGVLDPIWSIDRIIAQGEDVVSEWSCIWTPKQTQRRQLQTDATDRPQAALAVTLLARRRLLIGDVGPQ